MGLSWRLALERKAQIWRTFLQVAPALSVRLDGHLRLHGKAAHGGVQQKESESQLLGGGGGGSGCGEHDVQGSYLLLRQTCPDENLQQGAAEKGVLA